MQDVEKWRDRFEVSLDNRQIFMLFAASSVVLSLVFALGVVVGKRLTPALALQPKADALAMLDEADRGTDESLTFPHALGEKRTVKVPALGGSQAALTAGQGHAAASGKAGAVASPKAATGVKTARLAAGTVPKAKVPAPLPAVHLAGRTAPVANSGLGQREAGDAPRRPGESTRRKPHRDTSKAKQAKQAKQAAKDKEGADGGEGSFTLQVSAFQDRNEAEQLVARLRSSGMVPHVVQATIPGKGLWYRVRVGRYRSWKDALTAKTTLERKQNDLIAYVARL